MRLIYHHSLLHTINLMTAKSFLYFTPLAKPSSILQTNLLHSQRLLFCLNPSSTSSSRVVRPLSLRTNGYSFVSDADSASARPGFMEGNHEEEMSMSSEHFKILIVKVQELGSQADLCRPGQYSRLLCRNCNGGDSEERSLSLFTQDGGAALWMYFRAKCGWKGSTKVNK